MPNGLPFVVLLALIPSAVAQNPGRAVVRIYNNNPSTRGSRAGSGVLISNDGRILTAYHVIQGAQSVDVACSSKPGLLPATLVAYDETRDLAVVKVNFAPEIANYLEIGAVPGKLTDREAKAFGNPGGKGGSVIALTFFKDAAFPAHEYPNPGLLDSSPGSDLFKNPDILLVGINGTINPGMSGGPIVLDGKVIAIVSGTEGSGGGQLGWAIPASDVTKLKDAGSLTFASAPPLALLNTTKYMPLLKSILPGVVQERLTNLHEAVQTWRPQIAERQTKVAEILPQIENANQILSGNQPSPQEYSVAVHAVLASAQLALSLAKDQKLDILQIENPLFAEASPEIDEVTKTRNALIASNKRVQHEYESAVAEYDAKKDNPQTKAAEFADLAQRFQQMHAEFAVLADALDQSTRPQIDAAIHALSAAAADNSKNWDQISNLLESFAPCKSLSDTASSIEQQTWPIPENWQACMAASRQFLETDTQLLERQSADMQAAFDSIDLLIDFYTSPVVFEARQY
jgi:hypothetical protein